MLWIFTCGKNFSLKYYICNSGLNLDLLFRFMKIGQFLGISGMHEINCRKLKSVKKNHWRRIWILSDKGTFYHTHLFLTLWWSSNLNIFQTLEKKDSRAANCDRDWPASLTPSFVCSSAIMKLHFPATFAMRHSLFVLEYANHHFHYRSIKSSHM